LKHDAFRDKPQRTVVVTTIMAARDCRRNDILRRSDNAVTGRRQINPANSLREFHMVATQFSRTATDFPRRSDFPGDSGGTVDRNPMQTARVDLTGAKSPTVILAIPDTFPAVIVARPDTTPRKSTFWSSALDYLIESLGLCGAALHGVAIDPVALFEPAHDDEKLSRPRDIQSSERREVKSLISPAPIRHAPSPEHDRPPNHVTPAGYVIALSSDSPRERERKIKTTVAALAELDDRTLIDMGVPHRSQIEQVVRYCLDC
jgi:uncharacterized protein YjiS (DUF1127 family)